MISLKELLFEVLYGQRGKLFARTNQGDFVEFPALISKNTRSIEDGEKPYRVTYFDSSIESQGHADITKEQADSLMQGNTEIIDLFRRAFGWKEVWFQSK